MLAKDCPQKATRYFDTPANTNDNKKNDNGNNSSNNSINDRSNTIITTIINNTNNDTPGLRYNIPIFSDPAPGNLSRYQ